MKRFLLTVLAVLSCCIVADARKVSGSVVCGNEKLEGVVVTDGTHFTQTKANGKFSLNISDNADFVYIFTPSGYVAPYETGSPQFYQKAEKSKKKYVFELQKTLNTSDYSFIAIGDPQTQTAKHFETFKGEPFEDIKATAAKYKDISNTFCVALGDVCWDTLRLFTNYKEVFATAGVPVYTVPGNHDHNLYLKGDHNTTANYREAMGPENYAFFVGNDAFIGLDNIVYDTAKKYENGYSDEVVAFVKNALKFIPKNSRIFIFQHGTVKFRGKYNKNGKAMLRVLAGRDVTFVSGHHHTNSYEKLADGIVEQNVASLCGSWWVCYHCTDGSPRGYKVFENRNGKVKWYYKAVGKDRDYQIQAFRLGCCKTHPNGVVVNVWDYDPEWKVEWYQDGKFMGRMKQVKGYSPDYVQEINARYTDRGKKTPSYKKPTKTEHLFCCNPEPMANNVRVTVTDRWGNIYVEDIDLMSHTDVQAHRGGAGLMPENTWCAMKHAIDLGVNTLEGDLQVTKDGRVIFSHDNYFHSRYSIRPDGTMVQKDDPKEYIYTMPYDSVKKYDVGSRPTAVWPGKCCVPAVKPLASELIDSIETYVARNGLSPMRYNIEIKSKSSKGEGKNWPHYKLFVDTCIPVLLSKKLGDRLVIQCFDYRALNYMHEKYPELRYSYLIDKETDFEQYMSLLNFTPEWLSPHYSVVDEELCCKCREKGIKLVPWTVDEPEEMQRLIELGCPAIITNYPDRLLQLTRGYLEE